MEQNKFYQIKNITEQEYTLVGCDGSVITRQIQDVDNSASVFTIQDAKDGDVLYRPDSHEIFLFEEIRDRENVDGCIEYHCIVVQYRDTNEFHINRIPGYAGTVDTTFYPATKEQRDLLFQKIKEAGYEWDAEKKVLKKIGQKPAEWIQWTGKNLKEVIDFTGKSARFDEWFKSWDEYEAYVHSHGDILKLFCADGSHYEVPVGAWIVKTPDGYNIPSRFRFVPKLAEWSEEHEKPLLEKFRQAVYDCAWGKVTCKVEGETQEEYANRWAEHFLLIVRDWADDYIDSREDAIRRRSFDKGRQSIQNSAWGEEDEKNYNTILRIIRDSDVSAQSANRLVSWLKLNTIQSKQEWSEEDVLNLNQAIYVCHQHGYFGVETWLKSLKERIKSK